MRRSLLLIVVLNFALPAVAESWLDEALLEADGVNGFFSELVAAGGFGRFPYERAGFLILMPDGSYRGEVWPFNATMRKASFTGTRPAGTVAIAHTHPLGLPRPSTQDVLLAGQLGIPIVILTPRSITVAHPDGTIQRIVNRDWLPR